MLFIYLADHLMILLEAQTIYHQVILITHAVWLYHTYNMENYCQSVFTFLCKQLILA